MTMIPQDYPITGHVVLLPAPVHGHWPTLVVFAAKLVKLRTGTILTIFVVGDFYEKITHALDEHFTGEEAKARKNIRVIQIGGEGLSLNGLQLLPIVFQNFSQYFAPLASSSGFVCHKTGETYPGIRSPDVIIIDFFFLGIIHMIRTITQTKIPVYGWLSVNTACMLRFGSKEIGGYGDVATEAPILAKHLNKSAEEASYDMYFPTKGEVINIPGVPAMYDYEFDIERRAPMSELSAILPVIHLKNTIHQFMRECDGVLTASDDVLESEGNEALRAWFAETNRKVYVLGPLTPREYEVSVSEVSSFLSRMQDIYGEHAVLYLSFGTIFSPRGPGLAKILEVILDTGIPLIYSSAAGAKLPADVIERMNQSDIVFSSSWVPQRAILSHPATGIFMTHVGQNGFTEAISAGVPMIAYPVTADQPINAAYVSLKFNIGYELMEIRTEDATRPAFRGIQPTGTLEAVEREIRDVLAKAFGADGEEKRRNIRLLSDKRNALWDENGASRRDCERFIRENLP